MRSAWRRLRWFSPSSTPGQVVQDLGGPTPEDYRPDDDSAKLDPAAPLKPVKDVVNKGAKPAEGMEKVKGEPPSGGTTDAHPAHGEKMDHLDQKTPGQTRKEETEVAEEEISEEEIAMAELDIEEDVNALLNGEELSEEFQSKARTIFEAAIGSDGRSSARANEPSTGRGSGHVHRKRQIPGLRCPRRPGRRTPGAGLATDHRGRSAPRLA